MPNKNLLRFTVAALILIQTGSIILHFGEVRDGKPDFAALYGTGALILKGEKLPYDPSTISGIDVGLPPEGAPAKPQSSKIDTLHPPFETLIFAPLAMLPYTKAYIVWFVCNLVMFWSVLLLLWPYLPRLHADFHYIVILAGSFAPLMICLIFGQDSVLLLLLLTATYVSLERSREIRAGLFLGLGMFKFQLILPVLLVFVIIRRWKTILGFFGGLGALTLGAIALVGMRSAFNYIPFVLEVSRHISTNSSDRTSMMPNLRGLTSLILGHHFSPVIVTLFVAVISIIAWSLAALWIIKETKVPLAVRFALLVTISSLVSYHYYVYNSVILLLPILLFANELDRANLGSRLKWLFGAAAIAMYVVPNLEPLEIGMPTIACSSIVIATLLFRYPRACRMVTISAAGNTA